MTNKTDFPSCLITLNSWIAENSSILQNPDLFVQGGSSAKALFTLGGCRQVCGTGYQLWPWQDTFVRFSTWIVPAVVLITHFKFPPLPWWNTICVILHISSDPVDSLWSILMRQEVIRRLHEHSKSLEKKYQIQRKDTDHIAVIWCAYEVVGWKDPSASFTRTPTAKELHYIRLASSNLSTNQSRAEITSWVAIAVLLGSLLLAFVHTRQEDTRVDNETAHTIAIVVLLFNLIPQMLISGSIGTSTSAFVPVNEIENLRQNLRSCNKDASELFPPLQLDTGRSASRKNRRDSVTAAESITNWRQVAPWTGMNICWRPDKKLKVLPSQRGFNMSSALLATAASSFAILGSYIPALFLAMTNHGSPEHPVVFGCRSLSWTIVALLWSTSFILDFALCLLIHRDKLLWIVSICKDTVITLVIILVVLAVQLGFENNCWCRSNVISLRSAAFVNLHALSDSEIARAWKLWLPIPLSFLTLTATLTFFFILRSRSVVKLLCKDQEELQEDLLVLHRRNMELDQMPTVSSGNSSSDPFPTASPPLRPQATFQARDIIVPRVHP